MICATCQNWSRACTSPNPTARKWADDRGFTGTLAPQEAPPGVRCPGYLATRRANSRTTTPCHTEKQ